MTYNKTRGARRAGHGRARTAASARVTSVTKKGLSMARKKDPWGKLVLVEFDDGIAWVTMNRPEKRNAMSPAMNEEMARAVDALATDDRCGVLVLTGAGDSFAAGMDLKEYFRETDNAPDTTILRVRRTAEEWQWRRLRDYPKATIAMVNGWCFGGAFTPMVACDLAIAADEAVFGLSEINWGIIPAGNVTKATAEMIGLRNALYYAMTGETFTGKEAADMGLVNQSLPRKKLRPHTRKLARTLLDKNQTVLRGVKIAMKRVRYMDWDIAADYLYAKMGEALHFGASKNREAAMKAFLDDKKFRPGLEHFKGTT
jgi:trans-feruloyl-CoA hydratase/vanillin synthase